MDRFGPSFTITVFKEGRNERSARGVGGGTKDQGKGWSWRRGGGGVATKLRKLQSWPAAAAGGRGGFSSSEYIFLI